VKRGGTSTIIYRPGTEVSHGSHAWYRGLDSIDKNIVVEVLREKADQIRSSGLRFPAVAILCDADCAALQSTMMPDYSGMTIERTLLRFFTGEAGPPPPRLNGWRANPPRTSRLNGAFVLSISENFPLDAQKRGRTLCFRYCQNSGDTMFKMTDETAQELFECLHRIPTPRRTAVNAFNLLSGRGLPAFYGRYETGNTMKISALTLLDLLDGTMKQEDFLREYEGLIQALKSARASGKCLSHTSLLRQQDDDDDWFIFELNATDPRGAVRRLKDEK
jgi:hypothetical protein